MLTPHHRLANASILAALALAAPAAAQNAIGDGRALDANPALTSGGLNEAALPTDFAARNDIVTNSVIGGRGFRGSVGYTAADAFRDEAGSDDLFQFRADSAWSGVNFVNYNTTYQRFRFGQDANIIQYARVGQGNTSGTFEPDYSTRAINDARMRLDQLSFASLTTSTQESRIQPSVVGNMYDPEGNAYVVRASALGGLERTAVNRVGEMIGLTAYDFARVAEEVDKTKTTGVGAPYQSSYAELLASARLGLTPNDARVNPLRLGDLPKEGETEGPDAEGGDAVTTGDAELRAIRTKVAERYAQMEAAGVISRKITPELDEETVRGVEEDLRALRLYLTGSAQEEGEAPDPDDATLPRRGLGVAKSLELPPPVATLDDLDPDRPLTDSPDQAVGGDIKVADLKVADIGMVLRHGERIDHLTSGREETRFAELLASAEEALREGRYFWAERRFNRALRFTPGHPLATTGLVHTQIGAGLYLSAALTLRSLYVYQPEMIDARFAPGLLPNRPRLLDAVDTLAGRLDDARRDRSNAALLYAYVGRLLEEPQTIRRGLDVLAEEVPDDPLLPLLRAIWLGEEEPGK